MADDLEREIRDLDKRFPAALDYLTTIILLDREDGTVGNARIAERLGVSKPAVTQALARLKRLRLADQSLYGSISLTRNGRLIAARILTRHFLLEHLLTAKLGYPWDKADEEARRLQTAVSEEFTDYLYEAFGRPETCPHGNPLPGSAAEGRLLAAPRLASSVPPADAVLVRITEEGETVEGLLGFCDRNRLRPGVLLHLLGFDADRGLAADSPGRPGLVIPGNFTRYICYRPAT